MRKLFKLFLVTVMAIAFLDIVLLLALPVLAITKTGIWSTVIVTVLIGVALTLFGGKLGKDCMNRLFS